MELEVKIQNYIRDIYNDDSLVFDKSRFAGGLTNYNYIMTIQGKEYVVREPGKMTHLMIDRKIEKINNEIAYNLGLNSKCIFFDEEDGIKISSYIKDSKNIGQANPCDFKNIGKVTTLINKVHSSKEYFPNIFDWKEELEKYEQIIKDGNGSLFFDYQSFKEKLLNFMKESIGEIKLVPCHNDTVPENFLVNNKGKAYLIDWEYSGMNDHTWDVASYILESRLTKPAIDYFLLQYYGGIPKDEELIKLKCYMAAQDLLWAVWAMIRHYNGDDFLEYFILRYDRFKKNIINITQCPQYPLSEMVKQI